MARIGISVLAAAALAHAAPAALAQTEEELRYAAQVGEAQAEARDAEAELAAARAEGDPIIARYERLGADLDRLSAELGDAQRRAVRADEAVEDVPVTLTARRDALADRLIALYQRNGDPDDIARLEAARADVERQIAAAQSAGGPARLRRLQADREAERLYDQVQALRAEFQALAYDHDAARSRIEAAQRRLAGARETLHLAQDNARIFLADTAPPILRRVEVRTGSDTVYDAAWTEPAGVLEEQLRLARYLHEDLSRSTARRGEAVEEWSDILMRDQAEANRLLEAYVDMMGGSHDGLLGYVERGLDAISGGVLGAVIASGSHTWKKIGVELADAAFSIGMNLRSGLPPHAAVMTEAIFQITDVAARAITGEPKNPGWDVTAMPMAADAVSSYGATISPAEEQAFLENLSADHLRASLVALQGQVSGGLDADDYRDRLISEHGAMSLAAAFSSATVYAQPPDTRLFQREMTLEVGGQWLWAQFESPSGVVKSLIIEGIFSDEPDLGPAVRPDWPSPPCATAC